MSNSQKIDKRFQLLLTQEEWDLLKRESEKRGISASELIRKGLQSEISKHTSIERIQAIRNLIKIFS
jgi:hypothetical protein